MCLRSQIKRKHKLHVNFGTGLRLHGIHILNLFKSDVFFFFFFFFFWRTSGFPERRAVRVLKCAKRIVHPKDLEFFARKTLYIDSRDSVLISLKSQ